MRDETVRSPGNVLRDQMDEYRVDARATAAMTGIREQDIEAILTNRLRINEGTAARLEMTFGPSTNFWLALDERYYSGLAAGKKDVGR